MKKCIILLIFLIFMTCGCSLTYEIHINEDLSTTEKITITGKTSDYVEGTKYVYRLEKMFVADNNYLFTKKTVNSSKFEYEVQQKYQTPFDSVKEDIKKNIFITNNTYLLKDGTTMFEYTNKYRVYEDDSDISPFYAFDDIKIIVSSDLEIVESNSDKIENGSHIWAMKKGNIKDIKFGVYKRDLKSPIPTSTYYIVGGCLLGVIILLIIIKIIYNIYKKKNEI